MSEKPIKSFRLPLVTGLFLQASIYGTGLCKISALSATSDGSFRVTAKGRTSLAEVREALPSLRRSRSTALGPWLLTPGQHGQLRLSCGDDFVAQAPAEAWYRLADRFSILVGGMRRAAAENLSLGGAA